MMKKNLRFMIALWLGKLAMWLQKLLGMNASYFPGKLAIKLCPDFLGRIDNNRHRHERQDDLLQHDTRCSA